MYKFIEAKGLYKLFLTKFDYIATVNPFSCNCHILPKYMDNESVLRHERVHFEQIKENGACLFSLKYLYYLIRYGYKNNPFEVEAWKKSKVE